LRCFAHTRARENKPRTVHGYVERVGDGWRATEKALALETLSPMATRRE
jgi:hypothetical protein